MKRILAILFALGLLRGCSYTPVGGTVITDGITGTVIDDTPEPAVNDGDYADYFTETSLFDFELADYDHISDDAIHISVTLPFGLKYYASDNSLSYVKTNEQIQKKGFFAVDANWVPNGVYEQIAEINDRVTELEQGFALHDTVINVKTIDGKDVTVAVSKMYDNEILRDVVISGIYPLDSGYLTCWYNLIDCRDFDEETVNNYISDAVNSLKSLVYNFRAV